MKNLSIHGSILGFLLLFLCVTGCTSEEEKRREEAAREERASVARERCIDNHVSRCKKACAVDPIKAYCGLVYPDNVIGSGCVRHLDGMKRTEQIEACQTRACDGPVLIAAFEGC